MRARAPRPIAIDGLQSVCDAVIYPHVFANADREVGGVLVGRVGKPGKPPIVIDAIEAIAAEERRATLTFTQDAWAHVHRVIDERFPDDQIVGWYHSHPSFGIFLSEHDLFIHRNFFTGPSQFALVVDPISKLEGVFLWADGQIGSAPTWERATPSQWEPRLPDGSHSSLGPPARQTAIQAPASDGVRQLPGGWMLAVGAAVFTLAFVVGYLLFHSGS